MKEIQVAERLLIPIFYSLKSNFCFINSLWRLKTRVALHFSILAVIFLLCFPYTRRHSHACSLHCFACCSIRCSRRMYLFPENVTSISCNSLRSSILRKLESRSFLPVQRITQVSILLGVTAIFVKC